MNDVVRNYTWGSSVRKRRRDLRRRGRGIAKFVFPVMLFALLWMVWITRDSHYLNEFISKDAKVEVFANNIVERREAIIASDVWAVLPNESYARRLLNSASKELPAPEWLLNNISDGLFHISMEELDGFNNMVTITRMTRIGGLAERMVRFLPSVEKDNAGGLSLFYLKNMHLYYAVRGRVLLASPSRARLIKALTLSPENRQSRESYKEGIQRASGADLYCRMDEDAWTWPIKPFEDLSFSLRIEPDAARLAVHGLFSTSFMQQYAPFLQTIKPSKLPAPMEGILSLSANIGGTIPERSSFLAAVHPALEPVTAWLNTASVDTTLLPGINDLDALFRGILTVSEFPIRVLWNGMDAYEMLPVPLAAVTLTANTDSILALFEQIAPPPSEVEEIDWTPRLDEEHLLAHVPLVGGPNIEPTAAIYGNGVILSTSLPLAQQLQESPLLTQSYPEEGNLYARLSPPAAFENILHAAREFAYSGLLRGYSEESLGESSKHWKPLADSVQEIVLFAAINSGKINGDVVISMNESAGTLQPDVSDASPSLPQENSND